MLLVVAKFDKFVLPNDRSSWILIPESRSRSIHVCTYMYVRVWSLRYPPQQITLEAAHVSSIKPEMSHTEVSLGIIICCEECCTRAKLQLIVYLLQRQMATSQNEWRLSELLFTGAFCPSVANNLESLLLVTTLGMLRHAKTGFTIVVLKYFSPLVYSMSHLSWISIVSLDH